MTGDAGGQVTFVQLAPVSHVDHLTSVSNGFDRSGRPDVLIATAAAADRVTGAGH